MKKQEGIMMWFNDKKTQSMQDSTMFGFIIPIFVVSILLFGLILIWEISLLQLIAIVLSWSLFIYTFINIFKQTPHVQIPDYYSPWLKTMLYILHFIMASILFYIVFVGILHQYYPIFEGLVCCDVVKEFPSF